MQPPQPSKAQVLQSIKEFLEKRPLPAAPRYCPRCGTSIEFVDTHFLLNGTAMNWNVALPFCPVCDTDLLQDLPCPETIH